MFHIGHVQLLEACRKIAGTDGKVIVALNTDEFIYRFKKTKPVMSFEHRAAVRLASKYVDEVVANIGEEKSTLTIDLCGKVDFVVIGSDWAPPKDYYAQMGFTAEWLNERGITLLYVDRNTGMSTTEIKSRLRDISG
jgi:cytidyltransferase-like protein